VKLKVKVKVLINEAVISDKGRVTLHLKAISQLRFDYDTIQPRHDYDEKLTCSFLLASNGSIVVPVSSRNNCTIIAIVVITALTNSRLRNQKRKNV